MGCCSGIAGKTGVLAVAIMLHVSISGGFGMYLPVYAFRASSLFLSLHFLHGFLLRCLCLLLLLFLLFLVLASEIRRSKFDFSATKRLHF